MSVAYQKDGIFDSYQRYVLDTWLAPLTGDDALTVTRGHSLPADQLHVIARYARDRKIVFPEFSAEDVHGRLNVEYENHSLVAYRWWRTWGELLRVGLLVNPPLASVAPYDYIRYGENKKGQVIKASPHIISLYEDPAVMPCPLDLSQIINKDLEGKERVDIQHVADIASQAKLNGAPIRAITVEKKNGCVHLDLEKKAA